MALVPADAHSATCACGAEKLNSRLIHPTDPEFRRFPASFGYFLPISSMFRADYFLFGWIVEAYKPKVGQLRVNNRI
jgi:hypothetical protein